MADDSTSPTTAAGPIAPIGPAAAAPSLPQPWAIVALTFIAYLVAARAGLVLSIPPSNASPLFPAAGLGMAAAFAWGPWALVGILLGSTVSNLWQVAASQDVLSASTAAVWTAIGVGSAMQAGVGAWLHRRLITQPMVLSEPVDLARWMLVVVPMACLTSASIALVALRAGGVVPAEAAFATWGAWWVGDTLGVLIGLPLALAFIGQPREDWAPRRWSVALPMVGVTLVFGLAVIEVTRSDEERARQAFERDADAAVHAFAQQVQQSLRALEAMRGIADAAPALDRETFARAASAWTVDADGPAALGVSERVERAQVAEFEAAQRAAGLPAFRVYERWGAGAPPSADDVMIVIRLIEPQAPNAGALGVNARSIAGARPAIDAATRSGRPAATAGFALSQGGQGVVVYQALYARQPQSEEQRVQALRGVVFATLRPERMLDALRPRVAASLVLCLVDHEGASARQRIAPLDFAGRRWALQIRAAAPPAEGRAWMSALIGLASAALLGALLLTITGRARRIEAAVAERTDELQRRTAQLQAEAAQRQRTASALRESQQRLRNILDHAPIGVAYTDSEGRIREANPKLREMLGLSPQALTGMPIARVLHAEDRAAEAQARERLLRGEIPMAHWHLRCLTADHRTLWTRTSVSVLRGPQGEPRRMVWVMEDFTEHLALEEAQRARKGAEAANLAKNEFLSRMSHELRTPLNAMLGFTQLLELDRRQPLATHQRDWTAQMRSAGWHLLHMINDTLDLSRIEAGHIDLVPEPLDLDVLIDAARSLVEPLARKRDVSVVLHLGDGARRVLGDATRTTQILSNLLSNAIKYNRVGGEVTVTSRRAGADRVAIEVIDTGDGMDETQLAQLFEPFNRLGRESGPTEGTGIGLVISRRLAEVMGGSLTARSATGLGSTFTLELPRAVDVPARVAAAAGPAHDDDLAGAGLYRRRLVLYVEDNETNAEVMRGILALRPQVQLEVAALGLEGLAAIRARRPSLVLLDMQLPDIDGLELLRRLQADTDTADIPVVVVSADATEDRIAQAVAAGATRYLTKPIDVTQLLETLDEVLEQLDTHFG
ncbi:MAG TPA: CHASE domain-containing protein [Burkholderiaceae bacterium]|nr:CHASE domain-containing protein [Burkholderiaceae bacterium]